MATLRLCFIGDSITTGTGDKQMLGWPGRVCARAVDEGHNVTLYNLGVRGDTTDDIRKRWRIEAQPRMLAGMKNAVVLAFGLNDTMILETGVARVPFERTLSNSHAIMIDARDYLPCLFVGPAPVDDTRPVPGVPLPLVYQFLNKHIGEVNDALAGIAVDLQVPYVDVFTPLVGDPDWQQVMQQGDGVHPPAAGYEYLAGLISNAPAWRAFFSK